MEVTAVIKRVLLLLLLALSCSASAELRPVGSVAIPQEMLPLEPGSGQAKMLRVGILRDNGTPWNMVVGQDLYGINADYLVALSQSTGMRFEVEGYSDWRELKLALAQGKLDIIFGVPQRDAGTENATQPWFTSPLRIYRSRDNLRPVMFNSANARIAISRPALALVDPAFAKNRHWHVVDNDLQALYALLNNESDYVIADETSAGFLLSQLQQGQIFQLASPLTPGSLQLRAITASPLLTRQLDRAIRQLPMEVVNGIQGRWSSSLPRYQDTNTARLSPMERRWVEQHPVVTYAAISDDYPWSYRAADGQPGGYSVELLNIIGQNSGVRFQPRWVSNAQQAQALLDQGSVMIQLTRPLTGDESARSTTLPVWRALWGVYVAQSPQPVTHWAALKGKRIGLRRGDIALKLLPREVNAVLFDDSKSLYDALASGQIDALTDNVLSARAQIQSRHRDAIRLAFAASDTAWPVTLGVTPDSPLLLTLLNSGLQQIPADTQQRMRENWSNNSSVLAEGDGNTMRPVSLFVLIAALFAIVFLLILLLRRYLEQRRERIQRRQLEQAREEADRANRMKSQFLATVSHELRTPMQAILGLLELEVSRQPAARNLAVIHSSAAALLTLLNDLQDHARVESNSFTLAPHPLDPDKWLKRLAEVYHPLMRKNGPAFRVEALTPLPQTIAIDGERLQQIANNLIGNAIKFTREGEIKVTLAAGDNGNMLRLQVIDSGSGIPETEQARLFEPWYQTPSGRQLSVQGSGLGLSICKEIVSRMGGEIALESGADKGTTVTVMLPWQPVDESESGDSSASASPATRPLTALRVAIVDDHPTNLLVMQQQLAWFGIQADCYPDGRALLAGVKLWDLLFIDYSMPHPDGITLAKIIRRRERHGTPPARIVICSADADILKRPEVIRLADNVLLKPVGLREIEALLPREPATGFDDLAQRLDNLAGQQSHFLAKICGTLRLTLREDIDRLRGAVAGQAWPQAETAIHRIKGSWQMLGYSEEATLCQRAIDRLSAPSRHTEEVDLLISLTESLLTELENYGSRAH
ncbi:transporter substrate-binding domain-containing protein [Erwinia sp. P6884]|uniref:ATP-binding protein n=1 Tax=Erwinia sp. P6884 TaxID=3141450 RepID=UPI00318D44C2